jgi:hypothetical protein
MDWRSTRSVIKLAAIGAAFALALTVWPTLYRYDHTGQTLVRINRVTGHFEALQATGPQTASPTPTNLNSDDFAKLNGKAHAESSRLKLEIYNGSSFALSEVTVEVRVLDDSGNEIARRYRLAGQAQPESIGHFEAELGLDVAPSPNSSPSGAPASSLSVHELAAKVRAKYPNKYDSWDDQTLVDWLTETYPVYRNWLKPRPWSCRIVGARGFKP